jgi:hypothetical protein
MQDPKIVYLAKTIHTYYSLEQIIDLCFELGVEFEDLGGTGKKGKARELVQEMKRHDRLPELVNQVSMDRPNLAKSLRKEAFYPPIQIHRFTPYKWSLLTMRFISLAIKTSCFDSRRYFENSR